MAENGWVRYLKARYVEGAIEAEEFEAQLVDALAYDEQDELTVMPAEVWAWMRLNQTITDAPGQVYEMANVNAILKEVYS